MFWRTTKNIIKSLEECTHIIVFSFELFLCFQGNTRNSKNRNKIKIESNEDKRCILGSILKIKTNSKHNIFVFIGFKSIPIICLKKNTNPIWFGVKFRYIFSLKISLNKKHNLNFHRQPLLAMQWWQFGLLVAFEFVIWFGQSLCEQCVFRVFYVF